MNTKYTKSITRSINALKDLLADHRELVGNTELQYSYSDKCYRLYTDEFLSNKELFALVEVIIGARAFSRMELLALVDKGNRCSRRILYEKSIYKVRPI